MSAVGAFDPRTQHACYVLRLSHVPHPLLADVFSHFLGAESHRRRLEESGRRGPTFGELQSDIRLLRSAFARALRASNDKTSGGRVKLVLALQQITDRVRRRQPQAADSPAASAAAGGTQQ